MNILVLSAGGPAAVGVIKSLRDMNFEGVIITIDCDEMAVGLYLSDLYYVVPPSDSEDFIPEILDIIENENIDLILPTGMEIVPISKLNLKQSFMSSYDSIMECTDKFLFYETCKNNFDLPYTTIKGDIKFPFFAKPRIGLGGSKGASYCKDYRKYISLDKTYEYIYQEYLPGQEYTIDVLCDMESNPLVVIPRKRLQTKAGISSKGEIIRNEFIEKACFDMCKYLKLKGPICLQMKEDKDGIPKFVEVNPRFGGGTYFTTLAGVNFCKLIIDMVNEKELVIPEPKLIKVLRYFEEVII